MIENDTDTVKKTNMREKCFDEIGVSSSIDILVTRWRVAIAMIEKDRV